MMDKKSLNELYGKNGLRPYQQQAVEQLEHLFEDGRVPPPFRFFERKPNGEMWFFLNNPVPGRDWVKDRFFAVDPARKDWETRPLVMDPEYYPHEVQLMRNPAWEMDRPGLFLQQFGRIMRKRKSTYFTRNPLHSARLWAMAKKLRGIRKH